MERSIRHGQLRPDDRLPTIREVAANLAINPNTVLKAYGELEHEGLITSRQGRGTFVSLDAPKPLSERVREPLRRGLEAWLKNATRAGLDREAILALVQFELDHRRRESVA